MCHLLDFWGGPIACQDAEGFFTGGFPNTYIYTTYNIHTTYKNTHTYIQHTYNIQKHPPQNRTNVQIKGGGGQRPVEQCSKKMHFFERGHPLQRQQQQMSLKKGKLQNW